MHAAIKDIPKIIEICQEGHDLSPTYAASSTCPDRAAESLAGMICDPKCAVLFNGHGVLIGVAAPQWYSDSLVITNLFYYARKDGLSLLREFIRWGERFPGENTISISTSFGGELGQRAEAVLSKLGATKIGTNYKVA